MELIEYLFLPKSLSLNNHHYNTWKKHFSDMFRLYGWVVSLTIELLSLLCVPREEMYTNHNNKLHSKYESL